MAVTERWTVVSWTQVGIFIVCFLVLSVSTSAVNHVSTTATCDFQSTEVHRYPVGSSWEVRVGSQKDFQCINCTCLHETLTVQCLPMAKKCPDMDKCLKIVDVPNSCCPVCAEVENSITASRKSPSRTGPSQPATPKRCHHNGQVYQEGQRWAPEANTTAVRVNTDNQCVQCDCQTGNTICHLRMCSYSCRGVLAATPDSCCPVCQEFVENDAGGISVVETEEPDGSSDGDFDPYSELIDEEKPESTECISGPEKYEDGAQWNPIIPPFGRMKCVVCECMSGTVRCRRPTCDRDKLPCTRPVHKPGHCCPVCPEDNNNDIANVSSTGSFFCLREKDYLVYENLHDGIIEIALRLPEEETISLHTWKLNTNTADINSTTLKLWEFHREKTTGDYKFLGTARYRRVQRFSRRINKIRQTCLSRCGKRVESLVQVLRIHSAQSGRKSLCPDKFRPVDTRL